MKYLAPVFAVLCTLLGSTRCLPVIAPVAVLTSCASFQPKKAAAQTLLAVGHLADEAVATSARLKESGAITPAQARAVMDFYDLRFQPIYRLAASAAQANVESIASPELAGLAAQLVQLVATLQPKSP